MIQNGLVFSFVLKPLFLIMNSILLSMEDFIVAQIHANLSAMLIFNAISYIISSSSLLEEFWTHAGPYHTVKIYTYNLTQADIVLFNLEAK